MLNIWTEFIITTKQPFNFKFSLSFPYTKSKLLLNPNFMGKMSKSWTELQSYRTHKVQNQRLAFSPFRRFTFCGYCISIEVRLEGTHNFLVRWPFIVHCLQIVVSHMLPSPSKEHHISKKASVTHTCSITSSGLAHFHSANSGSTSPVARLISLSSFVNLMRNLSSVTKSWVKYLINLIT